MPNDPEQPLPQLEQEPLEDSWITRVENEPLDDWWIAIDQGSATEAEIDAWILKLEQESNDAWFESLIEEKPIVDRRKLTTCHPFGN